MTVEQFRDALHKGLGRAVLAASPEYREVILDACLFRRQHDRFFENAREPYLLWVADRAGMRDEVLFALLEAYRGDKGDRNQVREFLTLFARTGYLAARQALVTAGESGDSEALEELSKVDPEGLTNYLIKVPSAWDLPSIVWEDAVERFGADKARAAIEAAGPAVADIFFRQATAEAPRPKRPRLRKITFAELRNAISNTAPTFASIPEVYEFRACATEEGFAQAAAAMLEEPNEKRVRQYGRLFRNRAFPGDIDEAVRQTEDDSRRGIWIRQALENTKDERVRASALRLLETSGRESDGLDLLVSNFVSSDVDLIESRLPYVERLDEDDLHRFAINLLHLLERGLASSCLTYWGYESTPCAYCRESFARKIIRSGNATDDFRSEIRFDSEADTRSLLGP